MTTIEELLNSMQSKYKSVTVSNSSSKTLNNTKETWQRIGNKDTFEELGFSSYSELDEFLRDWMSNNPYNNI